MHTTLFLSIRTISVAGRIDGSASCCMMRLQEEYRTYFLHYMASYSRGHQCGGTGKITRHTHSYMCTQHSIPLRTYNLCSRLC